MKSSTKRAMQITVLAAALSMAYANVSATPVAYTPHDIDMDPGSWVKDRSDASVFERVTFQDRDSLKLGVAPPEANGSFYNWQGYSQRTSAAAGESFLRGDLWINDDWQKGSDTDYENTGMWGSAMPEAVVGGGAYVDREAVFPIIHFTNQKDVDGNPDGQGMLRVYDTTVNKDGGWIYLPETAGLINYDSWNSLDMRLIPADHKIEYYFNGSLVYTWNDPTASSGNEPGQFYAMYLQARNNGVTTFDTYWSRLLAGTVYSDGNVSGTITGDVMVDAGASVNVCDGTTISGSLLGNGNATTASTVQFDKSVTIDGNLIGTNTGYNFSTDSGAVAIIGGNVELEGKSAAGGGSEASRIQVDGNISLNDSLLSGYWDLNGSVLARNGARIEDANVLANNTETVVRVTGSGTQVAIKDSILASEAEGLFGTGDLVTIVNVSDHAVVDIEGGSIEASGGKYTRGILAYTGAKVTTTGAAISTTGDDSHAVHAFGDGSDKIPVITLNGGKVTADGDMSWGLYAQNGGQIVSSADVTTTGAGGFGVFAGNWSGDHTKITLTGGSVTTTGSINELNQGSHGVIANSAGAIVEVNNTTVTVEGDHFENYQAAALLAETGGLITTSAATINTTGDWAFGALADSGAKIIIDPATTITTTKVGSSAVYARNGGQIEVTGATLNTHGQDAHGAYVRNESEATITDANISTSGAGASALHTRSDGAATFGGKVIVANSQFKTTGANAHGVVLLGGSSLNMTGGSIMATGAGSAGVRVHNQSTATLEGVKVVSARSSMISSFSNPNRAQTINIGSGSDLTQNDGTLLLVSRETTDGIDGGANGTVALNLQSGSFAAGNVLDADGSKQVAVTKAADAYWAGIVVDKTTVVVPAGDSKEYTNEPINSSVASGEGSTIAFNNGANITGSVSSGVDSTTTFSGITSIGGDVAGQQGSSSSFGGATTIGGSVAGASGSQFAFTGSSTDIDGSVAGAAGSTFSFSGPTTIGGNLAGMGASFSFSETASTSIDRDVDLSNDSSIIGGSTDAPIQIGGSAQVSSGSTLGGNLNVAGAVSGIGGVLSPGNSIGAQTYGSLGQFTGTYAVEINAAGQSDRITITAGNVDLTGTDLRVRQEDGTGGYKLNHDYTIVETGKADGISAVAGNNFASQGLDETFAGTLVKLDTAKFGANTVKISLSPDANAIDALRPGMSSNQNATLDGVLSVLGRNASADAALQSQDPAGALNQLSGELHGSTQSALMNTSSLITRTLTNRMRGNLGAGMVAGAPLAQSSGSVPAGAMPSSTAYPLWAEVVGSWSSLDDDGNAAKVDSNVAGLFIGGDTAVGNGGWRLGGALGFTDGKIEVNDRSSKSDVTSYTAALYGGNSWAASNGRVNFLAGAAYTRHNVDSRRMVTVGGSQTLKADYDVNTTQLFTELGYAVPMSSTSEVEPYLGVAWLSQDAKGFTESGGSAALRGDSQKDDVTTVTLGLRGKTTVDVGENTASLLAGLGWRHAAGDVESSRRMNFIQGNGVGFKVAGAPIAKNAAVLDLGAEMGVGKNANLGLSYSGQFGNGNTDNTGSLYLKVKF